MAKLGFRPEFLTSPILYGRERVLILANGEKHKAKYAIVELENILASHNEYSFASTSGYPVNSRGENINDRNYAQDKNAQAKVAEIAKNFEPETQISTSATASGLPVITIDGIVVSGNNRTMSFKRMVNDFPENYDEYLKVLSKELGAGGYGDFGYGSLDYLKITIRDKNLGTHDGYIDNIIFKYPILVRIDYDFPAYDTTEMSKYNKDTKKAERPIDRAIKLSSMLLDNEGCFNIIADIVGKYESLSEIYVLPGEISKLKKSFIDCNILTEQELPAYFSENTLTAQGKEFFMNLLAGMILDKDALLSSEMEGVKRLKEKIVTALPVLIKNSKLPEGSLKNEITQAVILQQKMVASGMTLVDYIRSPKLFADKEENFSKETYYINELLNMQKFAFKQAIESYNNAVISQSGASLFGDKMTPSQIFNSLIPAKVNESVKEVIEKFYKPVVAEKETSNTDEKAKAKARARARMRILQLEEPKIMKEGGNASCKKGCNVEGKTHIQGGEIVELEYNEAVIKASAVTSDKTYSFEGKQMKPKEILHIINTDHGGNPIN